MYIGAGSNFPFPEILFPSWNPWLLLLPSPDEEDGDAGGKDDQTENGDYHRH